MNIDATLEARGDLYGDFGKNSAVMMQIVESMMAGDNWHSVPQTHRAALIYIAGKISRIVCGDPNAIDNWHDIGGYAKLVEGKIRGRQ